MSDWDDEPATCTGGDYQTKNDDGYKPTATQLLSNNTTAYATKQDEKVEIKKEEEEIPDDNNVSTRL